MMKLNSYQLKAAERFVKERIPALQKEAEKGSTGVVGKFMEAVRLVLNVRPTDVLKCRAANRTDIRIGRNVNIEVKTGSGAVVYSEDFDRLLVPEDRIPENILPTAKLVIWYVFPQAVTVQDILAIQTVDDFMTAMIRALQNSWLFTREQFVGTLVAIGKHGLESSLKVSKNGYQINIQTISHGIEARLWDILDTLPTADTLLK